MIAYVTGQNQVTLTLINLDTGNAVLAGDDVARTDTWSFSPCGDEFARTVVAPNGSEQIDVIATSDGRRIAQQDVPYESVTFTATEAEYLATVGDTTVTLGANLECVVTTVTVPTSIPYGYTSARVTLANDRPAPDGGVTLEVSTDSAYLTAPDAVTMGPGATSGSFTLTVAPVPSDLSATVTVTRSGVINDDVHALTVDVLSAEATQVSLDDSHVTGGGTVDGMVWIDQAAQGPGVDVALSSDSPAITAPATVHIPAGEEAAEFTATTTAVDTPTTATITAASGGKTVTTTLQVDPILAADLTVTLVPPSGVAVAGETVTITATVSRPPGADPTIPITPPTGTITFTDVGTEVPSQTGIPMGTVLGTATLHSSEAAPGSASGSLSTTGLAVGTHTIQVGYGGDGAYLASVVGTTVDVVAGLTWTGRGDGSSFSDPGNWSAGRAPRTGDVLGIQVADATTIDDDIPGLGVAGLHLSGPITLTGDSLTLTGDLVTHGGPRVEMLVEVPAGSHGLFADGLAAVSGAISGAGSLAITTSGTGTLALTADSSYTGGTAIDGSVETAAGTALGGGEVAVAAGGRLCIVDGSTLRASLTVAAGDLSGCAPPDGAESDDGGDPVSATLDGDLRIAGSLTLACLGSVDRDGGEEQHDDQFTHPLRIAGAITGAGGIRSCATDVTFAGAEANTYGGTTMLSEVGFDDRDYTAVLTLSKPDGVIALPGDLTGSGDLTLDADGQIATTATISAETLTVGGHTAQVADLGVHTLNVGIDGAVTGRVRVTGTADVSDVGVTVDSDATVGSTATVLDLTSSGAIADCPDDVVVPGSRVTDYRTDCSAGNGNDLALTAIWHPSIGIAADPPDGHLAGSDATITATVTAAPGAPAATGFVQFTGFTWRNGYWNPTGVIGSAQLSDGVATLTYRDSGEVMLRADYLGDSIHGPGTSGSMRYVSWSSPAASVPARPTDVAAGERDGGQTLEVTWTAPDGVAYPYPVDQIVDYHVTLTPDDGTPPVRVSTNVSDDPATYRYETFPVLPRVDVSGLHPGVTYAITVIAVNTAGAGPASDPAEFTMPADDGARPPGPPTTPVATAGQGQVGLTWTAPDDDGGAPIDHYEIVPYVHNVPGAPIDTPTDARSYTVAGLRAGTAYQFTVAAVTVAGVGDPSDPSDPVIPTAPAIVTTVPDAPTDLRVSAQGTAASLTWDAPDDGGTPIIGYRVTATIMKSGQGQSTSFVAGTWNADGTRITITLDTITDPWTSGTYRLTVAATNTVGTGPESDPVEVDAVYVRPGSGAGTTTGVATTTTTPPPLPSPTGDDGDSSNHVGQAGGDLAVTAGGFDPGEPVTITLHSIPVVLATVTADRAGTVNAVVHIPVDTVAGGHTLNLVGVRSGHQVVIALEVTAPPTTTSTGPTRPTSAVTSTGLRVVPPGTESAMPSGATTGSATAAGPPSDHSGLASTGAPIGGWLRLAGLLLLAGAGAVGLAARRRGAPARHR